MIKEAKSQEIRKEIKILDKYWVLSSYPVANTKQGLLRLETPVAWQKDRELWQDRQKKVTFTYFSLQKHSFCERQWPIERCWTCSILAFLHWSNTSCTVTSFHDLEIDIIHIYIRITLIRVKVINQLKTKVKLCSFTPQFHHINDLA